MNHIMLSVRALLACAIMVAVVFSIPILATALPMHLGISVSSWKQLLSYQNPNSKLPT